MAKNLCVGIEKERDVAVKVWREVKESLGERIGSRFKDFIERKNAATVELPGWFNKQTDEQQN